MSRMASGEGGRLQAQTDLGLNLSTVTGCVHTWLPFTPSVVMVVSVSVTKVRDHTWKRFFWASSWCVSCENGAALPKCSCSSSFPKLLGRTLVFPSRTFPKESRPLEKYCVMNQLFFSSSSLTALTFISFLFLPLRLSSAVMTYVCND